MSRAGSTVQGGQSIACEALQLGTGFEETFNYPNIAPFTRNVQGSDIVLKRGEVKILSFRKMHGFSAKMVLIRIPCQIKASGCLGWLRKDFSRTKHPI